MRDIKSDLGALEDDFLHIAASNFLREVQEGYIIYGNKAYYVSHEGKLSLPFFDKKRLVRNDVVEFNEKNIGLIGGVFDNFMKIAFVKLSESIGNKDEVESIVSCVPSRRRQSWFMLHNKALSSFFLSDSGKMREDAPSFDVLKILVIHGLNMKPFLEKGKDAEFLKMVKDHLVKEGKSVSCFDKGAAFNKLHGLVGDWPDFIGALEGPYYEYVTKPKKSSVAGGDYREWGFFDELVAETRDDLQFIGDLEREGVSRAAKEASESPKFDTLKSKLSLLKRLIESDPPKVDYVEFDDGNEPREPRDGIGDLPGAAVKYTTPAHSLAAVSSGVDSGSLNVNGARAASNVPSWV